MRRNQENDAPRLIEQVHPYHRNLGELGRKPEPNEEHVPEEPESIEGRKDQLEPECVEGEVV
jgi:hypothetical protein